MLCDIYDLIYLMHNIIKYTIYNNNNINTHRVSII